MAEMMFWQAIRRATDEELAHDPMVIVMGEDIGVAGGTYKATQGLYDKYGPERVMDTPISENGFTGLGIGASFVGVRPIIEIMSVNFAWLALDQIANSAAKVRYMSGGQLTAPVVIRSPGGSAHMLGAQHSGRMEKVFMGIAGLRVVTPSNARQAYGLLNPRVRCNDPVFINEHELMYNMKGDVPEKAYFRRWKVPKSRGPAVTSTSLSATTSPCTGAAGARFSPSSTTASRPRWSRSCTRSQPASTAPASGPPCPHAPRGIVEEAEARQSASVPKAMAIINEECFFDSIPHRCASPRTTSRCRTTTSGKAAVRTPRMWWRRC